MTVYMSLTLLLALLVVPSSTRANQDGPHVVAVVTARAQVLSGVRVGDALPSAVAPSHERRKAVERKPRERPCPEREAVPCRLMVVDIE